MKKLVVLFVALIASVAGLQAQNYMVVDSEQIFKSLPDYNQAITELEGLATTYQKSVDEKFAEVESLYNSYVAQESSMTSAQITYYRNQILEKEAAANEYQESIFSNEGTLMQRRIEMISPIQSKVFAAIETYAKANGFDLVLDLASNATILYNATNVDRTEAIINLLK
ncbi:MAG: OmpH family outer membrane protein [Rikenellaceae bacterium]